MSRTVFDCARVPADTCSVQISGDRDEVLAAAKQHLISTHGHEDNGTLEQNVTKVVDDHQKPYDSWF